MHIPTGTAMDVSINDMRLNVRVDGPEGAPWMVFSNSLTAAIAQWDAQTAFFGSRFRFLRYDQRGHGGSGTPAPGTTMDALADDLLALLDHFAVERAILVGVSMGATTVARCAARAPSRCIGVVPCDGVWRSAPGAAALWEERFAFVREKGMAAMAEPTVKRWFRPEFFTRKPDVVERVKAMVAGTSEEGYYACGTALQEYDFSADYPDIAVPVLYVAGAQDGDVPGVMREMAAATPDARYHVVDDCGHLPNIEQPEAFHALLDGFVRELGVG